MSKEQEQLENKLYWLIQNIEQLCRYAEKHHEYSAGDTESINLLIKEFKECINHLEQDLELYKKALDIASFRLENCNYGENLKMNCEEIMKDTLEVARKELSNERH